MWQKGKSFTAIGTRTPKINTNIGFSLLISVINGDKKTSLKARKSHQPISK